jgi:Formin Homology 2 Domain
MAPVQERNDVKRLNWNLIPNLKVGKTMFAKEEFQKQAQIDEDIEKELLVQFSTKPAARKGDEDGGEESKDTTSEASKSGPFTANILDAKRTTNILIMLRKFEISPKAIADAVAGLDPLSEKLSTDNVAALAANAFKDEELELARNYAAPREDVEKLNNAELFAYHAARVPRFYDKVKAMWTMRTSDVVEEEIRLSTLSVIEASQEVRRSAKFEVLLATVLGIGNFLNAGTAKGQARGFRLETLPKLCETKTRGGDMTLLHYIVEVLRKKAPDTIAFAEDMPHVLAAKRVSKEDVARELSTFRRALAILGQELTTMVKEAGDANLGVTKLCTPPPPALITHRSSQNTESGVVLAGSDVDASEGISEVAAKASGAIPDSLSPLSAARDAYSKTELAANALEGLHQDMIREFSDLAGYLGEDTRLAKTEELFDTLSKFILSFDLCVKENAKRKEATEIAERLAKRKADDEAKRNERRSAGQKATVESPVVTQVESEDDQSIAAISV